MTDRINIPGFDGEHDGRSRSEAGNRRVGDWNRITREGHPTARKPKSKKPNNREQQHRPARRRCMSACEQATQFAFAYYELTDEWHPFGEKWIRRLDLGQVAILTVCHIEAAARSLHADEYERALLYEAAGRNGWTSLLVQKSAAILARCPYMAQRSQGGTHALHAFAGRHIRPAVDEAEIKSLLPAAAQSLRLHGCTLIEVMDQVAARAEWTAEQKLRVIKAVMRAWIRVTIRTVVAALYDGAGGVA